MSALEGCCSSFGRQMQDDDLHGDDQHGDDSDEDSGGGEHTWTKCRNLE